MEGILVSVDPSGKYGKVDTRNNNIGIVYIKFDTLQTQDILNSTVSFDLTRNSKGVPYAIFRSVVPRNPVVFNTEDRSKWYLWGENFEDDFLRNIVPQIGRDIRKNPEKRIHPWAIDLIDYTLNKPADLKKQDTPFFTVAKYNYKGKKCDPTYSVTFNKKDYEKYQREYPNCDIYFWVHWKQLKYQDITVKEIYGVWRADFQAMSNCIIQNQIPLHSYMHRKNDDHNARDSYVFDIRDSSIMQKVYP